MDLGDTKLYTAVTYADVLISVVTMGTIGAGKRPVPSTLARSLGAGLADSGNKRPFFSNHSGVSKARKPSSL